MKIGDAHAFESPSSGATRGRRALAFALASPLCVLLLAGCDPWGAFENPVDPKAANYQGYVTVSTPDQAHVVVPTEGGALSGVAITCTKVVGATTYGIKLAASAAAIDSAPLFAKTDCASNVMDISDSGLMNSTTYFCKVGAVAASGSMQWGPASSFTTAWTTPAATPTFSPRGGAYSGDQSVTISCSTPNSTVYFTTDGSDPAISATRQSGASPAGPIAATVNPATTIRALATATGFSDSSVASAVFRLPMPAILVMIDVAGATYHPDPYRTVTLSSFSMSETEITQAQYATVTGSRPSWFAGDDSRPVEQVTWFDAVEFCNKLSEREGLQEVYAITDRTPATGYPITAATVSMDMTKNGYRLPTEAEFRFAAHGGSNSLGYTYSGSNSIDAVAWYSANSSDTSHPVGTKAANELGLYDLSGNVWEWCWDWTGSSVYEPQTDPTGPSSGIYKMGLGGGFMNDEAACGATGVAPSEPGEDRLNRGFRVVRRP